jgi:hypothetical protein
LKINAFTSMWPRLEKTDFGYFYSPD